MQGEEEVEQALKAATADRQFAEATLNRYKALLAKNSLSRQEYDGAEARYEAALANEHAMEAKRQQVLSRQQQARAQQNSAQVNLSYARIVSPLDGIVTAKSVDAGTVVMPGMPVLTVEDTAISGLRRPMVNVAGLVQVNMVYMFLAPAVSLCVFL